MTAVVAYEPFVQDLRRVDTTPVEWLCQRVPADSHLSEWIEHWRNLHRCGWDVTALVAPDSRTVVALGCR